jgi:signal transduction histidine kinase
MTPPHAAKTDRTALLELRAFERLLGELSAGFLGLGTECIDGAIEEALRRIVQALRIDRATLTQVSPLTGRIETTHSWAASGLPAVPRIDSTAQAPWAVAMARAGRPVVFARLDELPPEADVDRRTYERIGLKSHVTMPMTLAGTLIGGLSFGAIRRERSWPPALLSRLRLLADVFAGVLARQHAEQQRQRALDFERLATRILGALLLGSAHDEGGIVGAGLRDLAGVLGADRVIFWERTPGGAAFTRTMFGYSADAPAAEQWLAAQLPWVAARLQAESIVHAATLEALPDEAEVDREWLRALGVRSLLVLPVAVGGELVGAFSIAAVRTACDWPDVLLPGLRLLADVFAMLHVRRKAEARRHAAEAEAALWRERFAHIVRVHTVGEMSTALAHEITQPLGAIENYALAARRRVAADPPDTAKVAELLERIVAQAARAGDVVLRLRAMVKRHDPQLAPVDPGRVVRGCVDMLRGACEARDLQIEVRQAGALPLLPADEIHVQQVVLNLLRNAIEAMEDARPGAPRRIEVALDRAAGAVSVQVADHGHGLAGDDIERVFEPFRSTKAQGLGVGLAISRRLIEAHGGTLTAARRPGGGAVFSFTLPLANEADR